LRAVFWIVWAVLALFSILVLVSGVSLAMLIGFAILLALPVVLRRTLFARPLRALVSWAAAFVLARI
jgi:hypothetical protein